MDFSPGIKWDAIKLWDVDQFVLLALIFLAGVVLSPIYRKLKKQMMGVQPITLELHGYQRDFLDTLGKEHKDNSGALQFIVDKALMEDPVREAIFDDFHCIHCGSVSPEPWIAKRKGDKQGVEYMLTSAARELLSSPCLVAVEKRGEPPTKQIVKDAPKRSDASKAARCAIDWAIKDSGSLKDGKPKMKKAE